MKILILSLIFLTGCGIMDCDYQMIPQKEAIKIDPKLLEPCQLLVAPASPITPEGVLINLAANKVIYTDCATRFSSAIVILKKFSNN